MADGAGVPAPSRAPLAGVYRDGEAIVEAWGFQERHAGRGITRATLLGPSRAEVTVAGAESEPRTREVAEVSATRGEATLDVSGETWGVQCPEQGEWTVTPASGDAVTITAADGSEKTVRSKDLALSGGQALDGVHVLNVTGKLFVIEADDGQKLGQFTGADGAVRRPRVEFDTEAGRALGDDAKITLSWLARQLVQARTIASGTVVLVVLALMTVAGVLGAIFG